MNATLLRTELRALRPWWVLSLVMLLVTLLNQLLTKSGPLALGENFSNVSNEWTTSVCAFVSLTLGSSIAEKDREAGTLAFLDGLPLTRTGLFITKLLAALLVLVSYPGLDFLLAIVNHAFARGSLDASFRCHVLVGAFVTQLQMMVAMLAAGTLIGFSRSLTWLVVAVLAIAIDRLTHTYPRAASLNPLRLVQEAPQGVRWNYDFESMGVQAALSLLCVGTAWFFFTRSGRSGTSAVNPRPVLGALVSMLTVAALAIAAYASGVLRRDPSEEDSTNFDDVPSSAPATTTTQHYEFSYPGLQSKAARALAEQADAVFANVASVLGVDEGLPISVDLSGSMRNTVGTAFPDSIRMQADDEAVATLAHETAHVLARRLVSEEGVSRFNRALLLDEGLASWVEGHFRQHDSGERFVLMVLLARSALEFSKFVDAEAFARESDDELKYPIGRGLIEAMVSRYGVDSIHRLLVAFSNEKLSPSLDGAALWHAVFQLAGMDLGSVVDDFFAALENELKAHRTAVEALPRPVARLVTSGLAYGVLVSAPGLTQGDVLAVRFRSSPSSPLREYEREWVLNGQVAWRRPESLQGQQVCFQVGLRLSHRAALFEPWACLPLEAAAPWQGDERGDVSEAEDSGG